MHSLSPSPSPSSTPLPHPQPTLRPLVNSWLVQALSCRLQEDKFARRATGLGSKLGAVLICAQGSSLARPAMDKARAACCGLALSCSRSACSRRSCPWSAAWLAFGQRTRPGRPQLARKNRCKAQVIPVMYRWELIPGVGGLDELGPHASSLVVLGTHEVASEAWWARAKTIRYDHYTEDSCSPRC